MRKIGPLLALIATCFIPFGVHTSASAQSNLDTHQVTIPNSRQIDFVSAINGRSYRIMIALPYAAPPQGGYNVVYLIDGNYHFAATQSFARAQGLFGMLQNAVVVGIGYPTDSPLEVLEKRNWDLSTPISADALAKMPPNPGLTVDNTGGVDDFLRVIQEEIKPRVAADIGGRSRKDILIGHSFGGLAAVRALMTKPCSYQVFIAISPSLFWNDDVVMREDSALRSSLASGACTPRVYLGVGGLEQTASAYRSLTPVTSAEVQKIINKTRMIDKARQLSRSLQKIPGPLRMPVAFEVYPGESHMSEVPLAISRGLTFALALSPTS